MLRLPSLTVGSTDWRLPLDEEAAAQLLACLVTPNPRRQVELLAQTLKASPSFLLWLVCRPQDGAGQLETVGDLAKRWSGRLLQELRWPEPARASSSWLAASEKRWRGMRDRSLHVAELAASLAAARATRNGSRRRFIGQTYLLGLLHGSCEWLSSSGPAVRIGRSSMRSSPLPAWLVQCLREIGAGGDGDRPSGLVAAAVAQYTTRVDERNAATSASAVGGEPGLTASKLAGTMLPHVVARLQRLTQLESEFQQTLEQAKLESLRQFAYGASHEINNPLANISTRAQTLLREETNPERRRKLATINAQAFRAHEMISDMMLFAKPPELNLASLDAGKLVAGVVAELTPQAAEQATVLSCVVAGERLELPGDATQLAVAVRSLCVNSLEALGGGGTIVVTVRLGETAGQRTQYIEVEVRDSGPGIPPAARQHLFDPFYSGREAGRGLGLGLSKCWRIVTLHGGHIEVRSEVGRGATFVLHLPRDGAAAGSG